MPKWLVPIAQSRFGAWVALNVANPVDRVVMPRTGGRFSLAIGMPVLVLEHRGAKSGKLRRTPLQYVSDGDDLVVIASAGGALKHPAWHHNLRADPKVQVYVRGATGRYTARVAEGDERERLWRAAVELYPGYEAYRVRAGDRRIPVVVLSPAA